MPNREEVWELLAMARKDAVALSGMDDISLFADEIFGFHAQQATEKMFKALLAALGVEYPKTHDLSLLWRLLGQSGKQMPFFADMVELTAFSVQSRYEAFESVDEPLDRRTVRDRVEEPLRFTDGFVRQTFGE
jgi:HEPN domain-containing protein